MLKTVQIDGACLRYDILAQEHGHFQCDACGRIFNFSAAIDDAVTHGLEGFRVKQRDIYFRGLCAGCQSPRNTWQNNIIRR